MTASLEIGGYADIAPGVRDLLELALGDQLAAGLFSRFLRGDRSVTAACRGPGTNPGRCPVTALQRWMSLAGVVEGPLFRGVAKNNRPSTQALKPGSINALVQAAITRAGMDAAPYSAHSQRAGFVTYAHLRGASDRAIAHQTRHRSLATLSTYVRVQHAWTDNAATLRVAAATSPSPPGGGPWLCQHRPGDRVDRRPRGLPPAHRSPRLAGAARSAACDRIAA